ncbi:MFS transporter [Aureibaculum marinum]|uniref:MFS transporter n=1 Tax=Aureibaculum marinum TaxID=2487930 RepID=A0A3N4P804_9FLAO|nr:MFS transporter [Aureibaculum marinum]RPE00801.1 MFS transporter [Aureibaculum marinum]
MPLIDYSFLNKILKKPKAEKGYQHVKKSYLKRVRWAVSFFYFTMGLCFATWASRIPDIKTALDLSEGQLGFILLALPIGQLLAMPFSGRLVTKYGSREILIIAILCYIVNLTNLGLATKEWQLALGLFLFGISGNFCNISLNTQAVYAEKIHRKTIMSSFHGVWSLAGFSGALLGLLMMSLNLLAHNHFMIVAGIGLLFITTNYSYLIKSGGKVKLVRKGFFSKPDKNLLWLGVIGFCCMASEGIMFDWSGVYFKEIVKIKGALVILGYTSFMIMMATGRFFGDRFVRRYGAKKVLQFAGILISVGLFTAVLFPYLISSTLGFMLVGIGVSTVVPNLYSIAGKNKKVAPGIALTTVASVSFLGFLMGPPLIGYIAELTNLRYSFAFIGIFGFIITLMVSNLKVFKQNSFAN